MKLSKRVAKIQPSVTLAITNKAKQMKAQGIDVVGFGAGEPDFDTPDNIKAAAKKALDEGYTKYTPVPGSPELKDAIIAKLKRDNGLEYRRENIIVSVGAKHSIYNAAQALLEEGDEVIIPAPYWVSYPDITLLAGATPVIVEAKQSTGFKITAGQLENAITPKTKLVVLNSPSNPTGAAYSKAELEELAHVIVKNDIAVMSDEIYEKLIYGRTRFVSFASLSEDAYKRTLTLNGFSKAFSMTGWRLGYTAGPLEALKAMARMQDHMTSNPVTFAQYAALAALGPQAKDAIERMRREFERRAAFMAGRLNRIPGVECPEPTGAFYCFPDVSAHYGRTIHGTRITGSMEFAQALLEQANVAVVPGLPFGCDKNIRLSFACSMEQIAKGLDRLEQWLNP